MALDPADLTVMCLPEAGAPDRPDLATLARATDTRFVLAVFTNLAGKPCAKLVPVDGPAGKTAPEALAAAIVAHAGDLFAEVAGRQLARGPAAIVIVFTPGHLEVVVVVELEQAVVLVQVVEVAQRVARIRQGHQVSEERHLQGGARQQQALVPAKFRLALKERAAQVRVARQQRGQAQVERSDADAGDVYGCYVHMLDDFPKTTDGAPGRAQGG